MNNKPLTKFRDKGISLTVWAGRNGSYQVKLEKSYKPKDSQEWKKTDSYFPDELERLEKLCADARRWIHEQGKEHSEAKARDNGLDPSDRKYVPGGKDVSQFDDSDIPF